MNAKFNNRQAAKCAKLMKRDSACFYLITLAFLATWRFII